MKAGRLLLASCLVHGVIGLPPPLPTDDGPRVIVTAAEDLACGAVDMDTGAFTQRPADCEKLLRTNCSVTYAPMKCPSTCPYIVPNHAFACLFKCGTASGCSAGNPDRAYPDNASGTCMPCKIVGCSWCDSPDTCTECHPGFDLDKDKRSCTFYIDKTHVFESAASGVKYIIGGLAVVGIAWFAWYGRHKNHQDNAYSIIRARRHRHLVKSMQWELENMKSVRSPYNLAINIHKQNIFGVGVALLYNSAVFTIIISLLLYFVTSTVYHRSGAAAALSNFDADPAQLYAHRLAPVNGAPAVVVSRLHVCRGHKREHLTHVLATFARWNFRALALLWVLFFAALFLFATFQKQHSAWFNSQNATMADYVLRVTGLPRDATDEAALKDWLVQKFREVCKGPFPRPEEVEDGGKVKGDVRKARDSTDLEVQGVSLCYDYFQKWGEVDEALQTMMWRIEVDCIRAAGADNAASAAASRRFLAEACLSESNTLAREAGFYSQFQTWFEGADKIKTNGELYVIFTWSDDRDKVWKAKEEGKFDHLRHPSSPSEPIGLHWVKSEPPSVNWQYLGTPVTTTKIVKGLLWILFLVLMVLTCCIYPYFKWMLLPYSSIGTAASGAKTMIMGMLIGNLNMLISIQIWMTCYNIGFDRREKMDVTILFCNMALNVVNIGFSLVVSAIQAYRMVRTGGPLHHIFSMTDQAAIGTENELARSIFQMMVPGFFFVGNFMTLIMAGMWPYMFNTFLMKVIYVWAALPRCLLMVVRLILPWAPDDLDHYQYWRAERGLEPMEVQIGDYANLIIIPTTCSVMLFLVSPYTPRIFWYMFMWSLFYYCFLRYLHLRFCKKCYYTTERIDTSVNFLLGLPLSMVAAAACQWGFRAEAYGRSLPDRAKLCSVLLAFAASYSAWALTYHFGVKPYVQDRLEEKEKLSVHEVKRTTFYSWLNCNPVFVLKCAYYYHDGNGALIMDRHPLACGEDDTKVRYYQVGKEYLYLKPERQYLAFPDESFPGDVLEFETYFDLLLRALHEVTSLLRIPSWGKVAVTSEDREALTQNDTQL